MPSILLLQIMKVLSTERGVYRVAALFLLILFIIACSGCIFLSLKLDSCQSQKIKSAKLEGELKVYKEIEKAENISEVAKTNIKDQLLAAYENMAAKEEKNGKEWKKRADKYEEERDHCRDELSKVKEKKAKEVEYLECSKRLPVIMKTDKCESSSSS